MKGNTMEPDSAVQFKDIIALLWAPLIGWIMFHKRRDKENLDTLKDRVTKLETKCVTKDEVREIVRDETAGIADGQVDIKHTLTGIANTVMEIRLKQARDEGRHEGERNDN